MENTHVTRDASKKDILIEDAAIKITTILNKKLQTPVETLKIVQELNCLKYGIMTDNIPLSIEVYKTLEETGICILHKSPEFVPKSTSCYVNNPAGRRVIIDRSVKPESL